jgi:hypothetical protein
LLEPLLELGERFCQNSGADQEADCLAVVHRLDFRQELRAGRAEPRVQEYGERFLQPFDIPLFPGQPLDAGDVPHMLRPFELVNLLPAGSAI